jgi:hypothetical protein
MLNHQAQLKLFAQIADVLERPITCYAFGGTAMMFYGYKEETKDVDLLFLNTEDRAAFVEALQKLGFRATSLFKVYIARKGKDPNAPLMYVKDEYRLDLFAQKIFRSTLSPNMKEDIMEKHEFGGKRNLIVNVMNTEQIVYLKGITERDRDFEDIKTIVKKDKHFKWSKVVDEAIWQHENGDDWAILDTEKTLLEMKAYAQIDPELLKRLYDKQK